MCIDKEDSCFSVGLPLVRHPFSDAAPGEAWGPISLKRRTNNREVDPDAAHQDANRVAGDRGDEQAWIHGRERWWRRPRLRSDRTPSVTLSRMY
jgi:hypothetical protein